VPYVTRTRPFADDTSARGTQLARQSQRQLINLTLAIQHGELVLIGADIERRHEGLRPGCPVAQFDVAELCKLDNHRHVAPAPDSLSDNSGDSGSLGPPSTQFAWS
jgi:hypothetical protein